MIKIDIDRRGIIEFNKKISHKNTQRFIHDCVVTVANQGKNNIVGEMNKLIYNGKPRKHKLTGMLRKSVTVKETSKTSRKIAIGMAYGKYVNRRKPFFLPAIKKTQTEIPQIIKNIRAFE